MASAKAQIRKVYLNLLFILCVTCMTCVTENDCSHLSLRRAFLLISLTYKITANSSGAQRSTKLHHIGRKWLFEEPWCSEISRKIRKKITRTR